ncbi:hypothetical protein WJX84_010375 [Apatococcus fuscideae]|uniref:C3H1-type domain-containing protein n=1 Tax=Apatococcus fuscideae TaxID=2026836 RepID=A0AAW1T4E3_9CHLO
MDPSCHACKFWVNSGTCPKGAACQYEHPQRHNLISARQRWVSERQQERQKIAQKEGNPHVHDSASRHARASIFSKWLVERFGRELLRKGPVLDVAGGPRGEVAFELEQLGISSDSAPCGNAQAPADVQSMRLVNQPDEGTAGQRHEAADCQENHRLQRHIQAEFGPAFWADGSSHSQLVKQCSLVIGLHPDEATEAIVDCALAHAKPFAVVPCCVFPRLFPDRKLVEDNGSTRPVVRHDELVRYLTAKADGHNDYLKFQGRNLVVSSALSGN